MIHCRIITRSITMLYETTFFSPTEDERATSASSLTIPDASAKSQDSPTASATNPFCRTTHSVAYPLSPPVSPPPFHRHPPHHHTPLTPQETSTLKPRHSFWRTSVDEDAQPYAYSPLTHPSIPSAPSLRRHWFRKSAPGAGYPTTLRELSARDERRRG